MKDEVSKIGLTVMPNTKKQSELLFEEYLLSQGIYDFEFEKDWEGIPTHPDYTVQLNDSAYIFDVKEFEFSSIPIGTFAIDSYGRIREKIDDARRQFKHFKDKPCCLVLFTYDPLVRLQDASIMLGAMYGDFGFTMLINMETGGTVPDSTRQNFLHHGKMFRYESRQKQNTTISALITLRYVAVGQKRFQRLFDLSLQAGDYLRPEDVDFDVEEKHLGVIVWENVFARLPFPRDMFLGSYDERWGLDETGKMIKQTFVGNGIKSYREFDKDASHEKT